MLHPGLCNADFTDFSSPANLLVNLLWFTIRIVAMEFECFFGSSCLMFNGYYFYFRGLSQQGQHFPSAFEVVLEYALWSPFGLHQ